MSNWIIRCANRKCRHVCDERDWVLKAKRNPTEAEVRLRVKQAHCPKCDKTAYYRATQMEIERMKLPSARVEAACASE